MEKELHNLPLEILFNSESDTLSRKRELYLTQPLNKIEGENNFHYDLILKENGRIIGKYELNTLQFSKETNSLSIIYSLYSMKSNSHVPRELIKSFSNLQDYLSRKTGLKINHFAPINFCSSIHNKMEKKKGLINMFKSLGYESENQTEFLIKSYFPNK